ncbi:PREDICTED: general odorant-binding protein 67 [Drosophila arizonae]|uniref:General odorant-binding protein 67 n=1 Tax=Drosophila arizonae TaxID=7263 RepID=A0ABM1PIG3_DROAR|nr:PREDICTED: general odorant-binding protein 67 [Drosophila arizonae]
MLYKSQQLLLIVGLTCWSVAQADVDCSQKPKFVNPNTCCPLPEIATPELNEKCKEYLQTPAMQMESSTEGKRGHRHHSFLPPCYISCIFNETGIYKDNEVDIDALNDYLKNIYKDNAELESIATEAAGKCNAKMDEFKDKMSNRPRPSPPPGAMKCPHKPVFLVGCVLGKIMFNCPASIWSDTQECNEARDYFKACKHHKRDRFGGDN